ncbi:hypothetical protein SEUCBS139899_002500 [Sporothrix eucalyptigena]|uniref:Gfo/Idh/MocA-like oxidoreductase N-terminal domain-containing protein n=1 Tax=Sporothrix eucalyptigena TaxID=1812306 RepID=A0ABP0B405_9PEZI
MTLKVAIVGLSSRATTSWAGSAHIPYLLSKRGQERFQIVALVNSSVDAAKSAIDHFKLSGSTKAYGDPAALAKDITEGKIDVNLVTIATRVDVHYPVALPILKAVAEAKNKPSNFGILVEWPLASNTLDARELASFTGPKSGIRSAVSLQGRVTPAFQAVTNAIASGKIGRILSADVTGFGGSISRDSLGEGLAYFLDRSIGGNFITIGLGHLIDSIQFAIGDLKDTKALSQIQRPNIKLTRSEKDGSTTVVKTVTSNVPDLISVLGTLKPRKGDGEQYFSDGSATLQVRLRRGEPFPGDNSLVFSVTGEKGELRLTSQAVMFIQAAGGGNNNEGSTAVKISLHDFATNKVTDVPWSWPDWQNDQEKVPSRNIGALYEAYAENREADYATFADAVVRHEQIENWLDQ